MEHHVDDLAGCMESWTDEHLSDASLESMHGVLHLRLNECCWTDQLTWAQHCFAGSKFPRWLLKFLAALYWAALLDHCMNGYFWLNLACDRTSRSPTAWFNSLTEQHSSSVILKFEYVSVYLTILRTYLQAEAQFLHPWQTINTWGPSVSANNNVSVLVATQHSTW